MIDIGANLNARCFASDLQDVIARAKSAGVDHVIVTGASVEGSKAGAALASEHQGYLSATAGIHPHYADAANQEALQALNSVLSLPGIVAVGETGLDYCRNLSGREEQLSAFRSQIELAIQLELPLFVHDRESDGEAGRILAEMAARDVVIHCFTGSGAELDRYLELDYYIGITGWICDERRGEELRALAPRIPGDRLLLETDAPYLFPRTIRPRPKNRRNEPCNLQYVAAEVAKTRSESLEEVQQTTAANARRLFRLGEV